MIKEGKVGRVGRVGREDKMLSQKVTIMEESHKIKRNVERMQSIVSLVFMHSKYNNVVIDVIV